MAELLSKLEIANIRTEAHVVIDGFTRAKLSEGAGVWAAEVIVELCDDHDAQAQRIEELEAENLDLRAGLFSYKQGGFRVRGVVERYASERTGEVADEEAQADE